MYFDYSVFALWLTSIQDSGLKIITLLALAPLVQIIIRNVTPALLRIGYVGSRGADSQIHQRRVKTIAAVINKTSFVVIVVSVILTILSTIGIDFKALITGAGILGLAFGFGAQSLVKDVIAGLFILIENQYNSGDWVQIDSFEGRVTDFNLRRTILETSKGSRHIIPNGRIGIVTNATNRFSVVVLDIPIKLNGRFDKRLVMIEKIGLGLKEDPEFRKHIVETPHVVGVETVNESTAIVKVWGKTKPGRHVMVKRELARRIASEFSFEAEEKAGDETK